MQLFSLDAKAIAPSVRLDARESHGKKPSPTRTSLTAAQEPPHSTTTSHQLRRASNVTQRKASTRPREHRGSMLSLKAYYRKLRTFRGTVKALINLRRGAPSPHLHDTSSIQEEVNAPRVAELVGKLADDQETLAAVQNQVKQLVEEGHVVTEIIGVEGVEYRKQGNLELYTEENLKLRLAMQENKYMVALTQRLWQSTVADKRDQLLYPDYEALMLRLHRLILPEFDLHNSKRLILDDWNRDTDGKGFLEYRFFHFSMFELVGTFDVL